MHLLHPPRGGGRRDVGPPRHRLRQPVLRHAGRPAAARPHTRRARADLEDHRRVVDVPDRRLDVLLPPGALPRHRDQRQLHRLRLGQPARLRRPVAPGRMGARGARRPDDRVLAVADPALRRRDLLGRSPPAQRTARPHLRRSRPAGRGVREGRTARRRTRTGRRHHHGLFDAEQVADAEVPAVVQAGRLAGPCRLSPHLRPLLPGRLRCRPPGADRARPAAVRADGTGGGRPQPPRAGRTGAVHRRRRHPRLARRLRARGRPPGPRPAHRLRRPRGPGPSRSGAGPPGRGRGGPVRRIQQPGGDGSGPRRTRWSAPGARGCHGDAVDRGPHGHRRRGSHRVRAPALRPLARGHHPQPRRGPRHHRRHGAGPRPSPKRWPSGWSRPRGAGGATFPRPSPRPPAPHPREAACTSSTTGAGSP
ncbi:UNVERIFIED_CONTAM: hypothetical protein RKD50_008606 [Streptomyces canus]